MDTEADIAGGGGDERKHKHRGGLRHMRERLSWGGKVTGEDYDRMLRYAREVLESATATARDKRAASDLLVSLERIFIDVAKAVDDVDAPKEQTVNQHIKYYEGFDPRTVGEGPGPAPAAGGESGRGD
mgnify:CR=1 FL=1